MSSVLQSFQKRSFFASTTESLPLSKPTEPQGLRRRLSFSSLSLNLHSTNGDGIDSSCDPASAWRFCRSKSVSSVGEFAGTSIRKWWDWSWAWILSRKPTFAQDLEMNEEESSILGCHNKGSWRHVFYKLRSEVRRLVRSDNVGLPQTFRYDSISYSKNFDEGKNAQLG